MCKHCVSDSRIVLIFIAISILAYLVILDAKNLAYGAEADPYNPVQMRRDIDELKNRLNAINNNVPSEIEFCGERVPQERGYVRENLETELLRLSLNRKQFAIYIKRANHKYFPYIEKRLKELNMPDCLKYIPVIESALKPGTLSSAGAGGFWQFVPDTARRYGLTRNINWDDRADFEKATNAGLNYLRDLHKRFGSWALALAAYNAGENTVQTAIDYQENAKDYYDLLLPPETMQYNYRAIIAYLVMSKPENYGFSLKDGDLYKWPEVEEVTLEITKPKHVAIVAADLKISVVEFLWLNPQVKMPPGKAPFRERFKKFIIRKGTYTFKVPIR